MIRGMSSFLTSYAKWRRLGETGPDCHSLRIREGYIVCDPVPQGGQEWNSNGLLPPVAEFGPAGPNAS